MRSAARPLLPPLGVLAAVGVALAARVASAGSATVAESPGAAVVFTALLLGIAAARWRSSVIHASKRTRAARRDIAIGVAGGVVLVVLVLLLPGPPLHAWSRPSAAAAVPWTLLVVCIATAEELVFRGVLFDAVARAGGAGFAALVGALAFAVEHVLLYGWRALPLDLGVGLWLGGLRMLSGGVTAPAVAHAVADCGAWLVL